MMKRGKDGYYRKTFTYDGNRYGARGSTPELLYEKIACMKRDLKSGTKVVNENTPVKQWAEEWLETYKKDSVRQGSYDRYKRHIDNILVPAVGNMRIKDVRQVHLQRALNGLKGKSEDHVRKVQKTIYNIFERARKSNMIQNNPADDLEPPRTEPDESHRTITQEERKHVLALCETHRAGLWVLTMLYCGLRPGETVPLTWNDIDFDRAVLKITKAYERGSHEFKPPKSKAGIREIPIPSKLLEKFNSLRPKDRPFDFVFQQVDKTKARKPNGKHHTETSLNTLWNEFKTDLDISMGGKYEERGQRKKKVAVISVVAADLVPYCLRHTYCTDLEAAGVPINVAARLMGHANISLTSKIYTHSSETAFENAATAINKYFSTLAQTSDTPSDTSKPEKTIQNQ
ncbi:MAG: site-specific integrase [Bacillota bacterium]